MKNVILRTCEIYIQSPNEDLKDPNREKSFSQTLNNIGMLCRVALGTQIVEQRINSEV